MGDVALVLIIILILVIIWRGPKTLPQIGNMLGRGVKATREEAKAIREDVNSSKPPDDGTPPAA
jgi:Sec-independent protein translocase protein TatA